MLSIAPPVTARIWRASPTGGVDILSANEIEAVLDYVASHWSDRTRDFQQEITRQETDGG